MPHFELLHGESSRDFVLNRKLESQYLEACPHPLCSIATFVVDTGLRVGEALSLKWSEVF